MAPIEFTVYKASPSGDIKQGTTTKDDLKEDQVLIKITHSGVCYTDVHYRKSDIALGHEGVGIVERVGPEVQSVKAGDRVGWGYVRGVCGHCEMCIQGDHMYCPKAEHYGSANKDQGSFASHTVVRELFVVKIPDAISLENAGPFMCGGATVFEPLQRYGVQAMDRVGIVGLGGLGHLAIQFAAKMGCEVVVFSGSEDKREEAMELGATEFYAMKGKKAGEVDIGKQIKYLLLCSSSQPDWSVYIPFLAPHCTIFPLTVDGKRPVDIPLGPLNIRPIRIQGSAVASRNSVIKMLDFAARHNIKPIIQKYPMSVEGVQEALDVIEAGKMRYRGVLEATQ